nr:sarcosine oxidase subunit gamma family protein [Roseovarius autotrophicus]
MVEKSPCAGLVPVAAGALRLSEIALGPITSVAPYKGQAAAVAAMLGAQGLGWPAPGQVIAQGAARVQWFGLDLALLIGVAPGAGLADHAALADQSDGWAVLRLEGAGAGDVLARLTPLDLRESIFGVGQTARSDLGHMAAAITRVEAEAYEIMGFRSMAGTLVHEMAAAMTRVAARRTSPAKGR